MIEEHELQLDSPLAQDLFGNTLGDVAGMVLTLAGSAIDNGLITEERVHELEEQCESVVDGVIEDIDGMTSNGIEYSLALGQAVANLFVTYMVWNREVVDMALLHAELDSGVVGL